MTVLAQTESLPFLPSDERLRAYQLILNGCSHIWGREEKTLKRVFHVNKAQKILEELIPLTQTDPMFLAHLASYAMKKTKNKDLQVFTVYANSLSKADGTPFSPGSTYLKPNLRTVSAAAVHLMDPKLAGMTLEVAKMKFGVANILNNGKHFPRLLRTSFERYIRYIENNTNRLKGLKEAGLGQKLIRIYKELSLAPSDEAAAILHWQQKNKKIQFADSRFADFKDLDDLAIAKRIQDEKLPLFGVLANLPRKMSPVIAVALLEQVTGNQAIILGTMFEEAGILKDPEVLKLYEEKVKTASGALDRLQATKAIQSEAVKTAINTARSSARKEATRGLGKMYIHLDFSGSMNSVQQFASERGSILAECVDDPEKNFGWGAFGSQGMPLPLPKEFVKDAFAQILFNVPGLGGTDCFQLYPTARKFGAEVDIFVTDQDNMAAAIGPRIKKFHEQNPDLPKPKACVIVDYSNGRDMDVKDAYEQNDIPVALLKPEALTDSAGVIEAVKAALQGPMVAVDEIMNTDLLELPKYYFAV